MPTGKRPGERGDAARAARQRLQRVASAIVQGRPVDWQRMAEDYPELRSRLEQLRKIEALAESGRVGRPAAGGTRAGGASGPDSSPASFLFSWGGLQVLEKIGEGSFGEVFRAFDPALEREVALKLRRPRPNEPPGAHLEEARRLARVRHPHVLTIHGVETHDGRPGFWTDFLRGATLEQRIVEGDPLPAREIAAIGIDLCAALAAVHAAGIVHGDVKAANVMRESDSRVILMDFGAGSSLRDDTQRITGTPLVMAPETLDGSAPPSPASDVYALGVLLYRLATGRYPLEASSRAELHEAHRTAARIPLAEIRPDLPAVLVRAIERALLPDPAARTASAAALGADLHASLLGPGVPAAADPPSRPRRPARGAATNLPSPPGRFIGRERERAALRGLLLEKRIVTLVGPAGTGKTRLALEAANDLLEAFPGGVWWTALAPLTGEAQIEEEVLRSLRLPADPASRPLDLLVASIGARPLLLLLDNCEHLRAGAARFAAALSAACPELRLLATSREPLGIEGEIVHRVPPLSLPVASRLPGRREGMEVAAFEAVRLFVDRAYQSRASFALTRENAPAIARICRRLDGIPLAIELAAARVRSMGTHEIASRLERSLSILPAGDPENVPHRTLRASIEWSYRLLRDPERTLFRRLSVFLGRTPLEAIEAVAGDAAVREAVAGDAAAREAEAAAADAATRAAQAANAPEGEAPAQIAGESILDLLSSLVEKSLVVFDPPPADRAAEAGVDRAGRGRDGSQPAAPRDEGGYRMLEMVREFAAAESAAAGEEEPLRARHLAYFTARADQALRQLSGADQDAWLLQLERENDNLRAAMRWAALPGGDAEMGMRTAIGLRRLWYVRGWMSEGVEHVRALLASPTLPPGSRARGLIAAANLEWARGDSVPARAHCEEALAMLQEIDDPAARAASLSMLGTIECDAGNYDRAVSLLEEGIELRRRAGVLAALTAPLLNLGVIHARRGDLDSAQRCYEEALAVARETEDRPSEGVCLGNLSATARDRGDLEKAESLAEQSLEILRATENHRGLGHGYRTLGSIRMQRGRLPEAEEALRMELRILRDSEDARQIFENLEAFARLLLAQGRFEASAILHGALDSVRAQKGYPIPPSEEPIREGDLARLREALGEKGFAAACARGGTMSLDQAVGFVEDGGPASAGEGSS